jgi:hypothetical protein
LAAAQYTRTEIREYIRDLQSHYKPSPAESSTKSPPILEASYLTPSPDTSCCPQSSPGETTPLPPSAMEPTSRIRLTAKDKEYYLPLQHISPLMPSGFCTRQLRETWEQLSTQERKSVNTSVPCRDTTNLAHPEPQPSAYPPLQGNPT